MASDQRYSRIRAGVPRRSIENLFLADALVRGDSRKDRVQCSDPQWGVGRDCDAAIEGCGDRGLLGLQNDMAADLMNLFVSSEAAKPPGQLLPAQVARQLHATARTSSRTIRRRIEAKEVESK